MKIFILKKNWLFITLIILFIVLVTYFLLANPISFAVELSSNSFIGDNIKSKFASLCDSNEKIAYLTFDDGPTKKVTPKILDILKENNVPATFFVVGKHVKEHPEIVKRAYEEGHFIANHGYNHDNKKLYLSKESFLSEIRNTDIEIGKAIGISNYCSHVFRFPNGFMSSIYKSQKEKAISYLEELNYIYIDWNCLNKDSEKKYSKSQLLNNLKKTSKDKGTLVILMHDTGDVNNTFDVLEDSINFLKQNGYKFKNFYDLL